MRHVYLDLYVYMHVYVYVGSTVIIHWHQRFPELRGVVGRVVESKCGYFVVAIKVAAAAAAHAFATSGRNRGSNSGDGDDVDGAAGQVEEQQISCRRHHIWMQVSRQEAERRKLVVRTFMDKEDLVAADGSEEAASSSSSARLVSNRGLGGDGYAGGVGVSVSRLSWRDRKRDQLEPWTTTSSAWEASGYSSSASASSVSASSSALSSSAPLPSSDADGSIVTRDWVGEVLQKRTFFMPRKFDADNHPHYLAPKVVMRDYQLVRDSSSSAI